MSRTPRAEDFRRPARCPCRSDGRRSSGSLRKVFDTDPERRPERFSRRRDLQPSTAGERAGRCRHRLERDAVAVPRREDLGVAIAGHQLHGDATTASSERKASALVLQREAVVERSLAER